MTLTETVGRLAYEGISDIRIAEETNTPVKTVRKLIARCRDRHSAGVHRKDMAKYGFLVRLEQPCIEALIFEAGYRSCRPTELAERVLERIFRRAVQGRVRSGFCDGMVKAVLDDEGDGENG